MYRECSECGRQIPFDETEECDLCGKQGAFTFSTGDCMCNDCAFGEPPTSGGPVKRFVRSDFEVGDIVRVKKETFHGKRKGRLAEVLGCNEVGWPRIKYDDANIETLPTEFLELVCLGKMRSS